MTSNQRETLSEYLGDPILGRAIKACLKELDEAIALARRFHAECGPEYTGCDYICESCKEDSERAEDIQHDSDCLWLAAEAVLEKAKNGEGKP